MNKPEIKVLSVGMLEVNCILAYDPVSLKGMIVDPGDEAGRIAATVKKLGIVPESIILTHGHGDHIGAVDELREMLSLPVAIGKHDAPMLADANLNLSVHYGINLNLRPADRLLDDGDRIEIGEIAFDVVHTPGHTRGSITLVSDKDAIVGDLIFCGSVGRTDLPGGSFQTLLDSIRDKILTLPDDARLYPGHGPATTVGDERTANPFLSGVI